jgi:hypothetical protein
MYAQWFTNFGMTPPEAPKDPKAKGAGFGGGAKKGGPKTKKKAAPAAQKLYCHRPPEGMVTVLRAVSPPPPSPEDATEGGVDPSALAAWGEAARRAIDEAMPATGAVLLRGLPMRSAEAFAHFWRGCLAADPPLEEGRYISLGGRAGRDKLNGVDLATNVPPQFPLLCHNELCYNPTTVGHIALYCVQDAPLGGETIVTRNRDLKVPDKARKFLAEHGGLLYSREFFDARSPPKDTSKLLGSWQEKCSLPDDADRDAAEAFFEGMGFDAEAGQLKWGEDGTLKVTNQHPGFVSDPVTGEEESVWWNIAHTGQLKCADGAALPKKLVAEIQQLGWEDTFAFKLRPGDWLMLDNKRMQHGRLPYEADPSQKRVLLTVYTTPTPSIF